MRHSSVEQLPNDVQRWLDDRPVSAYRDKLSERFSRWVRQHPRWSVALPSVVAMIGVVAGIVAYACERIPALEFRNRETLARAELAAEQAISHAHAKLAASRQEVLWEQRVFSVKSRGGAAMGQTVSGHQTTGRRQSVPLDI